MTEFPIYLFFAALSFCWGACIGSFLNVCIYRIPQEISLVRPGSFCPHCKTHIAWYDNIPLFSILVLRARCRHCRGRIPVRYFVVELLTAVLFLLIWLKLGYGPEPSPLRLVQISNIWLVPIYWLAVSGLILGTFVDFDYMIIPDRVTIGGVIAGLLLSAAVPELHGKTDILQGLLASLTGVVIGFVVLWAIAGIGTFIFRKEAMGMGDVKLLAAIGAFCGWRAVMFSLMISSLVGATVGITLILMRRKAMQSRMPYGPYLALAAVVWILWGPALWNGYLSWIRPDLF